MTTPADEAAEKLIRLLNTIVAPMGKRLGDDHRAVVREICELLSADGTLTPLDDLPSMPRMSPAEIVVDAAERDPGYQAWKKQRGAERSTRQTHT
jgi:hypothetical protein